MRHLIKLLFIHANQGQCANSLDGKRKGQIEAELEVFLAENAANLSDDPALSGYYNTRRFGAMSPVKREFSQGRTPRRRVTMTQVVSTIEPADAEQPIEESPESSIEEEPSLTPAPVADISAISTALAHTPARSPSFAERIPLPATPADVALAVERTSTAMSNRVAQVYAESKIPDRVALTRTVLSTVTSIIFAVNAFELYFLRREILADKYFFTIPAIEFLGTKEYPVDLPDMFLILTSTFWYPALTWVFTSFVGPCFMGYFFNLSAAAATQTPRVRTKLAGTVPTDFIIDPVTFSIVKALLAYVVYKQGVTFGGWLSVGAIERINGAIYGGWQGVLTGTAITGLAAVYDAVLRK